MSRSGRSAETGAPSSWAPGSWGPGSWVLGVRGAGPGRVAGRPRSRTSEGNPDAVAHGHRPRLLPGVEVGDHLLRDGQILVAAVHGGGVLLEGVLPHGGHAEGDPAVLGVVDLASG